MSTQSILIIDDCDNFRMVATDILLDAGYIVSSARCPHEAFDLIRNEKFDLILCDLHMPFRLDEYKDDFQTSYQVGIMTINELQALLPKTTVVALTSTAESDIDRIRSALKGIKTLSKPKSKDELFIVVKNVQEYGQMMAGLQ